MIMDIDKIRLHAGYLRIGIIGYTVALLGSILMLLLLDQEFTLFTPSRWPIFSLFRLLLAGYAIWYTLNLSPIREHSKATTVLLLLFLGPIGLWIFFPWPGRLERAIKRSQSPFNS